MIQDGETFEQYHRRLDLGAVENMEKHLRFLRNDQFEGMTIKEAANLLEKATESLRKRVNYAT